MSSVQLKPPSITFLKGLKRLLRTDQISSEGPHRLAYGRDACSKGIIWARDNQTPYPPDVVVWPENTAEVSKVLRFANENRIAIIPFGGGSGVCGGTWALRGGIAVDLKRMNKIRKLDARRLQATVQAGIVGEVLERELQRRGMSLGHFPSSIYAATLGGYLACRSAGQYSSLYGKIEDMVEELEVVLADGTIVPLTRVNSHPNHLDLIELFLGSEGTLGCMTEARLNIHPLPAHQVFSSFSFKSLEQAERAIREIMQRRLKPFLVRLYDPLDTKLFLSHVKHGGGAIRETLQKMAAPLLDWVKDKSLKAGLQNPSWLKRAVDLWSGSSILILGFHGERSWVEAQRTYAEQICRQNGGNSQGEEAGKYWLDHRYSVSYRLSPLFDDGFFADTMEVATYWSNIPHLYTKVREALFEEALVFAHFSHAYAEGCSIYFTFVGYAPDTESSIKKYDRLWHRALSACTRAGGTISHHHGVGLLKAEFMKEEWGASLAWLQKVKDRLDPHGILNPGKLGLRSAELQSEGQKNA